MKGERRLARQLALQVLYEIDLVAHPIGEALAHALAELKQRAHAAGIPVIYVNDNFNHWQSDFRRVVEYCLRPDAPGRATTALLEPGDDDYFVIKPRHSGFYQTNLALLLSYLDVPIESLVIIEALHDDGTIVFAE